MKLSDTQGSPYERLLESKAKAYDELRQLAGGNWYEVKRLFLLGKIIEERIRKELLTDKYAPLRRRVTDLEKEMSE